MTIRASLHKKVRNQIIIPRNYFICQLVGQSRSYHTVRCTGACLDLHWPCNIYPCNQFKYFIEKKNCKEDESPHDVNDKKSSKTSLEEAKEAIDLITEKIERSTTPLKIKIEPLPSAVERLVELGFANRDENRKLLTQNENNLEKVIS